MTRAMLLDLMTVDSCIFSMIAVSYPAVGLPARARCRRLRARVAAAEEGEPPEGAAAAEPEGLRDTIGVAAARLAAVSRELLLASPSSSSLAFVPSKDSAS